MLTPQDVADVERVREFIRAAIKDEPGRVASLALGIVFAEVVQRDHVALNPACAHKAGHAPVVIEAAVHAVSAGVSWTVVESGHAPPHINSTVVVEDVAP